MPPLRLALIGCGAGARRHHLPILATMPGVEIRVLADPDAACLAAARRHAPAAVAVRNHVEALARPDVDAAVLCLPGALHAPVAIAALERGRPVYVEKPIATSLDDAERVVAAWRRAGVVGMVGFNYRANRLYETARRHLETGTLGPLVAARTVFSIATSDLPEWKRTRRTGGGALLDLGSHHLDLVRHLFPAPVVEVRATIASRRSEDDVATVDLRLADGVLVQSFFAFGTTDAERFEIHGRDATLIVDRRRYQDVVVRRTGTPAWLTRVRQLVTHVPYVLEKRRVPGHEPSHRHALARFVAAVTTGGPATPDLDDGHAGLALVLAAERAARTGQAVAIADDRATGTAEARRG